MRILVYKCDDCGKETIFYGYESASINCTCGSLAFLIRRDEK